MPQKTAVFFPFFLPQFATGTFKLTFAMPQFHAAVLPQFAFCPYFSVFGFGRQSLLKSKKNPPFRGDV
jgi:hypothetical protein